MVERGPGAAQAVQGQSGGVRGAGEVEGRAARCYLARQLGREGGQAGGRRLAERRVRVLQQRLVRVDLPRSAAATCGHTRLTEQL